MRFTHLFLFVLSINIKQIIGFAKISKVVLKYYCKFVIISKDYFFTKNVSMRVLFSLLFFISLGFVAFAQEMENHSADAGKNDEIEVISVEKFQDKADSYIGKELAVTGIVDHVCKHGGKKVVIVSEDGKASLKIMAGDKISKFDKNIEGETITVVGIVREKRVDEDYLSNWEIEVKDHHKPEDPEYKDDMAKIEELRAKIKESPKGYLSFYSMDGNSYHVNK
jgi:hypothetical protein